MNTKLEAEGAEFLVLGQMLVQRIVTHKTYTNMAGYDLLAANPETNRAARIQVKSRWRTGAPGFLISNLDCEFVVVVRLNRGRKDGGGVVLPPEFFIFPIDVIRSVHQPGDWSKVMFKDLEDLEQYRDNWALIEKYLKRGASVRLRRAA